MSRAEPGYSQLSLIGICFHSESETICCEHVSSLFSRVLSLLLNGKVSGTHSASRSLEKRNENGNTLHSHRARILGGWQKPPTACH